METRQIKKDNAKLFVDGKLNISYGDLSNEEFLSAGDIIRVTYADGEFVGHVMITFEQKTLGWIVSTDDTVAIDDAWIADCIREGIDGRTALFNEAGTNVFRLFNDIGDGIGGMTIDNFDNHYLVTYNSIGTYWYHEVVQHTLTEFSPESIVIQRRFSVDGKMVIENEMVYGDVSYPIIVEENFLHYYVHLLDGPMTRFFIDQREVRKSLLNSSHGQTFLNLFAYSGSFSIAAAKNGMTTTSVDLAKRSIELIRENFIINEIDVDAHAIYIMDTFDYLRYAARKGLTFDCILIDPPSFARNKSKVFKVERDYPKLIEAALAVLAKNGTLILSQNLESFTLNQFKSQIKRVMGDLKRDVTMKDVKGLPKDFKTSPGYKRGKYLKVVTLVMND